MKGKARRTDKQAILRLGIATGIWALLICILWNPLSKSKAAVGAGGDPVSNMYRHSAPQYDLNATRGIQNLRQATGDQIQALNNLKGTTNAQKMTARWNDFGGSPDVIYDFASQPLQGTPEGAARAFINQNSALFGLSDANNIRVFSQKAALGGTLIRFQQTFNGVPVSTGGIGVVLNGKNQVIMLSGPFFRDVSLNTQPTLSAAQANSAAEADLGRFAANIPSAVANLLQPGLNLLAQQTAAIANLEPQLGIYPTADGYRLVWKVAKFSTNPFGLYLISVDAQTGEIVERKDYVKFQTAPNVLPFTADIYPKYPRITDELKNQGIISDCGGAPCDQQRVSLRSFDSQNVVSGLEGTLKGDHTIVNNVLATKQPFLQAAKGTWHFAKDDPTNFEARTNEQDQFAEPAEHQDEINAFFFNTYLVEYVGYLHVGGDPATFGSQGSFPDTYPNSNTPLPATVHIPDVLTPLAGGSYPPPTDPEFKEKVLGLDNAFALPVSNIIADATGVEMPVVLNPVSFGHGFYFNDTALEGTVPYHEGMHAITSPIAGWEGTEGGAMNEGQADEWAFTITDNPSLGDYVVNAYRLRQRFRDLGRDPDSIAYIRSARSTLKYSDIGTYTGQGAPDFEVHRDGEIFMSTMWDFREMLNRLYPQNTIYKRPRPVDGQPLKPITKGTNIFERDFLGQAYVLGTTSPDTFVKARDAMIVADQMLYPSDATDPGSPGKHRAMIEQIFAAKEIGVNAVEVTGGRATISTQVTPFAGNQAAPTVPANVQVSPASQKSLKVAWSPVSGALAYEVLKRKTANAGRREPNGLREFNDGDSSTTGYRHVAFVDGSQAAYEDKGPVREIYSPAGLNNLFDSEYVVRSIGANSTGQLGFSDFSGSSQATEVRQDLTSQVDTAISNISFTNGVMAFDNKLTNSRGALSTDPTIYTPVEFQIVSISNPTVTVRNADTGADTFVYNQTLALGTSSAAKRLEFNDPSAQLFSFDARVYGNAYASSTVGTGSQAGDGSSNPPAPVTYSLYNQAITGTLLAGDPSGTADPSGSATWGNPTFKGITWDDFPVTTKSDAISLEAALSSSTAVDLDFELRTADGQIIMRSAGGTPNEFVSTAAKPNTTYILRVLGFANGPATFNIAVTQLLPNGSPNANGGTRTVGGSGSQISGVTGATKLVRFTVNPLTKAVTFKLL
jgi:Zinc metalloprotease (elastase)